jgi:protein-L-isoaspartate(D-aspartate) O-methyltransferase
VFLSPLEASSGPLADARFRRAAVPAAAGLGMDSAAVRTRMVERLRAQGVSERVCAAFARVERHRFVDTALAGQAYEDTSLPIGLGQTISKPNVVARMLDLLLQAQALQPGSVTRARVLEVGTGCGYQAALMAQLVGEVYSVERLRGLHERARENIFGMGLHNLQLILGDGMLGYARGAPYAAILAAAGGEAVPQAWIDQLATGGRIIAPVAHAGGQALVVIDKTATGVSSRLLEAVQFVPLKSGVV